MHGIIYGAISFINFPLDFYGIGDNTLKANQDHMGQKRFKLNFEADKNLGSGIYLGVVAGGFNYSFNDKDPAAYLIPDPRVEDRDGGAQCIYWPKLNLRYPKQ